MIQQNLIGTGSTGDESSLGNYSNGIFVNLSSGNTIGGLTAEGNVISGNRASGVMISGDVTQPVNIPLTGNDVASGNIIAGNMIGLNKADSLAIPNAVSGVIISAARGTYLGKIPAVPKTDGNAISGNLLYGVLIANNALDNTVQGNWIGTDANGMKAFGNTADGVFLIGGDADHPDATSRGNHIVDNVISGNEGNGIQVFGFGSTGNFIQHNKIGLGTDGATMIANQGNGVLLNDAGTGNMIGGGGPDVRNVISGNSQSGVMILSTSGRGGAVVQGNYIGTDGSGLSAKGNGGNGVFIYGSTNNAIGGSTPTPGTGMGNVISGNSQAGVAIFNPVKLGTPDGNTIGGNLIGLMANGINGLPNGGDGIDLLGATNNWIGQPGARNVISGNASSGVFISTLSPDVPATGNVICNNYIGTDASGSQPIAGSIQHYGVLVNNASTNTIGRPDSDMIESTNVPRNPSNVISGNSTAGVELAGSATGNVVQGNYIGVGLDGKVTTAWATRSASS